MIVVGIVSLFFVATALSAAAFFGSTPIVVSAAIGAFFFFDLSFFRTETPKKIFFLGKEVGETREGNNFIPLRKILFRMEGEKKRSSGEISKTIRMILRLMALFVLIGVLIGTVVVPFLSSAVRATRTPTRVVAPGEYRIVLDPGEKTQFLSCRGRWDAESTGNIRFVFPDGREKDYFPATDVDFGPYNTFSVRNTSPEKVTIFLSVFN